MANGGGINVILAVREHIEDEISDAEAAIAASETKLTEQRAHLYALFAIRHAAGIPAASTSLKPEAEPPGDSDAPALHVA